MCDQDDFEDMVQYQQQRRRAALSRRQFAGLTMGAGLLSLVPAGAYAAATTGADVEIKTPDGTCDAYFVHPASGKHPAVLIWPDIFGLRPAFKQMATRLAESGYSVLVVNPFYRLQKAPTSAEGADMSDPDTRKQLVATDAVAVSDDRGHRRSRLHSLARHAGLGEYQRKWRTTGYCMGGPFTFRVAAAYPGPGRRHRDLPRCGLATNAPDSPHLLVPKMKARADRHRCER